MSATNNSRSDEHSIAVYLDDDFDPRNEIIESGPSPHTKHEIQELIETCYSTSISLLHEQLTDSDMPIIVDSAIIRKKCTELKLGYNQITSEGVKTLADALKKNSTLEHLNLFHNNIADQGVYYLTQALLSNEKSKVKMLFIGYNQITDKSIEYLCNLLKSNRNIVHLGLSNNEISDRGIIVLANVLTNDNITLKELYLWGNKSIGDMCVDALADMLVYNRSLMKLVLFDCNLSDLSKERLREVVQSRKDFGLFL
ncbi:unnamed protein product [Adineta ricciae]|uniref:Uncharacterized protein n=1 Tax=Adineta ricciae TaxID=249248 RepID=A0A813R3S9_ADIRI|nr:unnamed protein product [Adineta ricciae]CAF0776113.1 unnamed protein product [Adineta ricciae]